MKYYLMISLFLLSLISVPTIKAEDIVVQVTRVELVSGRAKYYNACIDGSTYRITPANGLKLGKAVFTTKKIVYGKKTQTIAVLRQGNRDYSFVSTGRNC